MLPATFCAGMTLPLLTRLLLRGGSGEAAIGLGILCVAAALIGRDTWTYGTVAVIVGTVLFAVGAWLNRVYLIERISNRGALRRGAPESEKQEPKRRIR